MHLFIQTVHLLCGKSLASKSTTTDIHTWNERDGRGEKVREQEKEQEREKESKREMKPHCQGTCHKAVFSANMTMARMCCKACYFKWPVQHNGGLPWCRAKSKGWIVLYAPRDQRQVETKRQLPMEAANAKSWINHTTNRSFGSGRLLQKLAVSFDLNLIKVLQRFCDL